MASTNSLDLSSLTNGGGNGSMSLSDGTSNSSNYNSSSSGSVSGYDQWYKDYMNNALTAGQTLSQSPYNLYQNPRIASWTGDQQDAFNVTRDTTGMWRDYLDPSLNALGNASTALNSANALTNNSSQYNDPTYENTFWQNYAPTVNAMQQGIASQGEREFTNNIMSNLNDNFVGAGQFGSARHQILGADAAAMADARIREAQANVEMQGRQAGMNDYLNWAKQGLSGASNLTNQGANWAGLSGNLWNTGLSAQNASAQDAARLMAIGDKSQQFNQVNMDLGYKDFQNQVQYPWQMMNNMMAISKGQTIPNFSSSSSSSSGGGSTVSDNSSFSYNPAMYGSAVQGNPTVSGVQGALTVVGNNMKG